MPALRIIERVPLELVGQIKELNIELIEVVAIVLMMRKYTVMVQGMVDHTTVHFKQFLLVEHCCHLTERMSTMFIQLRKCLQTVISYILASYLILIYLPSLIKKYGPLSLLVYFVLPLLIGFLLYIILDEIKSKLKRIKSSPRSPVKTGKSVFWNITLVFYGVSLASLLSLYSPDMASGAPAIQKLSAIADLTSSFNNGVPRLFWLMLIVGHWYGDIFYGLYLNSELKKESKHNKDEDRVQDDNPKDSAEDTFNNSEHICIKLSNPHTEISILSPSILDINLDFDKTTLNLKISKGK